MSLVIGFILVGLGIYLLSLPANIAKKRGHRSAGAIGMLTGLALFGLLFGVIPGILFWVIALVWSLTGNTKDDRDQEREALARSIAEAMKYQHTNAPDEEDVSVQKFISYLDGYTVKN